MGKIGALWQHAEQASHQPRQLPVSGLCAKLKLTVSRQAVDVRESGSSYSGFKKAVVVI